MIREFLLPDVGEGLVDATIVAWLVSPGDEVALNQPLCTIETAKAEVELPSPFAGRVVEVRGAPGEVLAVGDLLAQFEVEPAESMTEQEPARQSILVGYGPETATPGARRRRGRGRAPAVAGASSTRTKPLAKPPVRKLARDLGVDLAAVTPTGPGDTITRDDVTAASRARTTSPAVSTNEIPLQGIRARIAARMEVSRRTIPEATCGVWADCTALLRTRELLRSSIDDPAAATALTPFSLVMRFVVIALSRNPLLNSTLDEQARVIRLYDDVHLGVAMSTDHGLLVPVVRNAGTLSTLELAVEAARLSDRARAGSIGPGDLVGSTFTVNNYGGLGLDDGNPVINHPEAAILGVGAIRQRAVVVDGDVVARPTAKLILSFDHRICDGAEAARFLADVKDMVEAPERALLHV